MSEMMSLRERATPDTVVGADAISTLRGLASAGRAFGSITAPVASLLTTGAGCIGKIGAGCGPGCRNRPLMITAPTAVVATRATSESFGRRISNRPSRPTNTKPGSSNQRLLSSSRLWYARLRTFLHRKLDVVGGVLGRREHAHDSRRILGRAYETGGLAVNRQSHGDARALADPAVDRHSAAMQRGKALDDRQAEPGPFVRAIVGPARLEERLPEPRQVIRADADAVVRHRDRDRRTVEARAGGDAPAAIGELDGVREKIEQDLLQRPLVGGDLRQAGGNIGDQLDRGVARLEREQTQAIVDNRADREWLRHDLELAGLDLRHVEDAIDHRKQMMTGLVDQ